MNRYASHTTQTWTLLHCIQTSDIIRTLQSISVSNITPVKTKDVWKKKKNFCVKPFPEVTGRMKRYSTSEERPGHTAT